MRRAQRAEAILWAVAARLAYFGAFLLVNHNTCVAGAPGTAPAERSKITTQTFGSASGRHFSPNGTSAPPLLGVGTVAHCVCGRRDDKPNRRAESLSLVCVWVCTLRSARRSCLVDSANSGILVSRFCAHSDSLVLVFRVDRGSAARLHLGVTRA